MQGLAALPTTLGTLSVAYNSDISNVYGGMSLSATNTASDFLDGILARVSALILNPITC